MEQQKTINYAEELANLKESQQLDIWKPKQGRYKIEILNEPEDTQFVRESGEVIYQWRMSTKVNGEPKTWFVPKSSGKNSIRGQLIKLATLKGNKLKSVTFDLLVVGENKDRRYTIPEAL